MFERFTESARKVMALAFYEAEVHNHPYIGSEHVLLALVKEGSGVAAKVLAQLHVKFEALHHEVEKLDQPVSSSPHSASLPFTPRVKEMLDFANDEARQMGHDYVGTEHLLLGLLREHRGVAAQMLENLKVKPELVRAEVLKFVGVKELAGKKGEPTARRWIFAGFSDTALKAFDVARAEAQRFKHHEIFTEHLLLGLAAVPGVFEQAGLDAGLMQRAIEARLQTGSATVPKEKLVFGPQVKNVLGLALLEARELNHQIVSHEHLLLSLLQNQGAAGDVLRDMGLQMDSYRAKAWQIRAEYNFLQSEMRQSLRDEIDNSKSAL